MQSNKSNGQLTAQINMGDHKKSGFDLSNNVLGTGKIGRIIPTRALHVMPGDTIKADSKVAVQFEPLAVPILANMDVKQEHFYVPYNVVWKNWDKFISGGEKLDYNGVVPNTNISTMFDMLWSYFGLDQIYFTGHINIIDDEEYEAFSTPSSLSLYHTLKDILDTLGDTYYIKDLLSPQYEVLKMFYEFDLNSETYVSSFPFVVLKGPDSSLDNLDTRRNQYYDNFLDMFGLKGNKYMEELRPYVLKELEYNSVVLPTDLGFAYIDMIYEYLKPFIGLGSNIDYLNMSRLTLTELITVFSMGITKEYLESSDPIEEMQLSSSQFANYLSKLPLSILNLRANYNIWYNNYRDILLEENAYEPNDTDVIPLDELFVLLVPRQRCWEKDAFTTALDNPGTGSIAVPMSIGSVTGGPGANFTALKIKEINDIGESQYGFNLVEENSYARVSIGDESWELPTAYLSGMNPKVNLDNNGVSVNGFSLYQLDAAQRAQKWLQKALFFGNRISDFYYMRFGVRFLDARLRLPELLTSSSELVKLDIVMNNTNITTEAGGEVFRSIAGDRAAYASAYDNGNSFERFCEEHGVIMSYLTIMPQITYAYGINRDYSRLDQFDFAFAEFATLGMDAVYDTEITASNINGTNFELGPKVFGYQGRYYDYKAKHSEEHGELLDSQDMYTFARKFNMLDEDGRPKLNYEFVHCFPSLDMFVVDSTLSDYFRYDIRHSTAAERELPAQSIYI